MRQITTYSMLLLLCLLAGCRGDIPFLHSEEEQLQPVQHRHIRGFFLLNEGNMGSNKASLDFFDVGTGKYQRNIYPTRNPGIVKELGDVGNDIAIYGSKLYAVINCSHYVEVMDVHTGRHVGSIDVLNCRYIVFHDGKAYISSYAGPVQIDPNARPGKVVEVDTTSLKITREVVVGYQPEEMAVLGGKLYVANSGGYLLDHREKTVSVVDLASFTEEGKIEVAPNLHRLRADRHGRLWATSRGDYWTGPSRLFRLTLDAAGTSASVDTLDIPVSDLCIVGDSLYYIGVEWSYETSSNKIGHGIVDVARAELLASSLTSAPEFSEITLPYGIIVNPEDRDFYVMDAKDYLSSGQLYHFRADGTFEWRVWTGDIPGHAAFVYK